MPDLQRQDCQITPGYCEVTSFVPFWVQAISHLYACLHATPVLVNAVNGDNDVWVDETLVAYLIWLGKEVATPNVYPEH